MPLTTAQAITALALPPKLRPLYVAICENERQSIRELTETCGFSSTSVTNYRIRQLIALGLVRREAGKARMLEVVGE